MNERIVIDPTICHGKPVVRGTRTPVTVILSALAGGDSFETLEKDYSITDEDIRACIAFAASEIEHHRLLEATRSVIRPGTGDWDAAEKAAQELRESGYDFDAWREQREYDLKHANDHLP